MSAARQIILDYLKGFEPYEPEGIFTGRYEQTSKYIAEKFKLSSDSVNTTLGRLVKAGFLNKRKARIGAKSRRTSFLVFEYNPNSEKSKIS